MHTVSNNKKKLIENFKEKLFVYECDGGKGNIVDNYLAKFHRISNIIIYFIFVYLVKVHHD